jgi:hypothetical protein
MKRVILFISPLGIILAVPLKANLTVVAGIFLVISGVNWMALWLDVYQEMQGGPSPAGEDASKQASKANPQPVKSPPARPEPAKPAPDKGPSADEMAAEARAELERVTAERLAAVDKLEQAQKELAEQAELIANLQKRSENEADDAKTQLSKLQRERELMNQQIGQTADELAAQIMISLGEAEQAISSAIEAFTSIASDAQEAHDIVERAMGNSEVGLVEITQQTNDVMNSYLQRLVHSSSDILEMSRQLQEFRKTANKLIEPLNTVEGVTRQTMMIALGAAKAASKDGQATPAVQAVIEKVQSLGETAHGAAEKMHVLLREMSESTDAIADSVAAMGQNSLVAGAKAQQDIHHLLPLIKTAAESSEDALNNLHTKSESIGQHYKQVVMAFQFHDMLRQRLEHVAQPLCLLRDTLNFADGATPEELSEKLAAAMESTRSVIPASGTAPALDVVQYAPADDDEGDVTLF